MMYKINKDCENKINILLPTYLRLTYLQFLAGHVVCSEKTNEMLCSLLNVFSGTNKYLTLTSGVIVRRLIDMGILMEVNEEQKQFALKEILNDPNRRWPKVDEPLRKRKKKA